MYHHLLWRVLSSGIYYHEAFNKSANISTEHVCFTFKVKEEVEQETSIKCGGKLQYSYSSQSTERVIKSTRLRHLVHKREDWLEKAI
jgi:hypothetical protein